jgi:hypothetical protein
MAIGIYIVVAIIALFFAALSIAGFYSENEKRCNNGLTPSPCSFLPSRTQFPESLYFFLIK